MKIKFILYGLLLLLVTSSTSAFDVTTEISQERFNGVDSGFTIGYLDNTGKVIWDNLKGSYITKNIDGDYLNNCVMLWKQCYTIPDDKTIYLKSYGDISKIINGSSSVLIESKNLGFYLDFVFDKTINLSTPIQFSISIKDGTISLSGLPTNIKYSFLNLIDASISGDIKISSTRTSYTFTGVKSTNIIIPYFGKPYPSDDQIVYTSKGMVTPLKEIKISPDIGEIYIDGSKLIIDPSELTTYNMRLPVDRVNPFTDINESFAKEYILNLSDKKVINGYEDKTFKPNNSVTRAEFLKMIMNKNKIDISSTGTVSQSGTTGSKFSDTTGWIIPYAEKAKELGFIQSSEKFNPNNKITRAEAIKILLNVSKKIIKEYTSSTYKDVDGWKVNFVETAKDLGIINSSDFFRPNDNISRAESSKIIDLLN